MAHAQNLRPISVSVFLAVFCCGITLEAVSQTVDPENVLIRNVRLIESDNLGDDVIVNILIRDNKLELVTTDKIPASAVETAVDAQGGYLLGSLAIGAVPSLIILRIDPRDDFDVMLNMPPHITFAIHDGELRKNTLVKPVETEPDTDPPPRWLAYTPRPTMLPFSYKDEAKWNQWGSKYFNGVFLAMVVLDRQRWFSQDENNRLQVGDLEAFNGGEIRALRFGTVGTLNFEKPWVYTLFVATRAFEKGFDSDEDDDFVLFDYRLDIPLSDAVTMSIGKQREPISMERIMPLVNWPMQERTAHNDAMLVSRNVGVVISGATTQERWTWAGGLFNDWFDDGQSISESSTEAVGRVTWLPALSEDETSLLHLGVGLRYSNAKEGIRFMSDAEFNNSPIFVDTGEAFEADHSRLINAEVGWRFGHYWLQGEWMRNDISAPIAGDPTFGGYSITGSWVISGEMRNYNKRNGLMQLVPVAKSVYQGGWGAWELSARYSSVDLTDAFVTGGEMDIWSLGVSWWLSPIFNFNLNYRHVSLDRFGLKGSTNGVNVRVMLSLE